MNGVNNENRNITVVILASGSVVLRRIRPDLLSDGCKESPFSGSHFGIKPPGSLPFER